MVHWSSDLGVGIQKYHARCKVHPRVNQCQVTPWGTWYHKQSIGGRLVIGECPVRLCF